MRPTRRRALWLWAITLVIALVTVRPWSGFVGHSHWQLVEWVPFTVVFSPRDIVANTLLFVPFGFAFGWHRRRPPIRRAVVTAALFSMSVELYQVYCHNHFPTTADVLTNTLGAWIGAHLAWRASARPAHEADAPRVTHVPAHPRGLSESR